MKTKYQFFGIIGAWAVFCALFFAPLSAFAYDNGTGPSMLGGTTTFAGTLGATTDTSSSTMKMPTTKPNAYWGPAGYEYGGTYSYNLTCSSCHNFESIVKAHRVCADCHTDSTGAVLKATLRSKDEADPTFFAQVSACSDCHNGTLAPVAHGTSAQSVYSAHAMDTQSKAKSCGATIGTGSTQGCHIQNIIAEHRSVETRYVWDSSKNKAQRIETGRAGRALACTDCHKIDATTGRMKIASAEGTYGITTTEGACFDCHPDSHMTKDSANYNKMLEVHQSTTPLGVWSLHASGGPRMQVGENAILAHGVSYNNGLLQVPVETQTGDTWGCSARYMCHNSTINAAGSMAMQEAVAATPNKGKTLLQLQNTVNTCGNPYGNPYCHYGAAKPLVTTTGEYIAMDNGSMDRLGKPGYLGDGQWWDGGTFLEKYCAYLTLDLSGQTISSGTQLKFKNKYYFQDTSGVLNSYAGTDPAPDYGKLQVRVNKSGDWTDLWSVTGEGYDWSYKTVDLSAYAGQSIEIRWASLGNADQYNGWGWQLQDISLRNASDTVTYQAPMDVTSAVWNRASTGNVITSVWDDVDEMYYDVETPVTLPADYGFYSAMNANAQIITTNADGTIIGVSLDAYNAATKTLDLSTGGGESAKTIDASVLASTNFSGATTVILPATFEIIPDDCFKGLSSLSLVGTQQSISLGGLATDFGLTNLRQIGSRAFAGTGLSGAVTFSANVESIGSEAFINTKLASVTVAKVATTPQAMRLASTNQSIMYASATGTSIGDSAFENLSTLTSVDIGSAVNSIGASAFKNTGLTTLTFQEPMAPNLTIGQDAFWVPSFNQISSTPDKKLIADQAGVTMSYIFNNPNNVVPASSFLTIALIVLGAFGLVGYVARRAKV